MAWYFERLSRRKGTSRLTYGYQRYRILGGLITGLVLLAGLCFVLWHSIQRLASPEPVHVPWMIGLALLGILFNGAAVLRVRRGSSLTEKLVSWHLIEDTLGWVAVLIGAGVMAIWDLPIIDPILSILIALMPLWNVGKNLKKVGAVFLQTTPAEFDLDAFIEEAESIPGVESLHHIHSWSIDGERHALSAHVIHDKDAGADGWADASLKNEIRSLLDEHSFEHVTLELEDPNDDCPQR